MPARDPAVRSAIAREAALTRHALGDTKLATREASRAAVERFERMVDPDGTLPPAERATRADRLRRAHMSLLSRLAAALRRAS